MALQTASVAKTASDAANIQTKAILTSLVMVVIDDKITAESERTTLDERTHKAVFTFDADINGRTSPVEIIQSDQSKVFLTDIIDALVDAGYRTAFVLKRASRQGGQDRVTLTVAWD